MKRRLLLVLLVIAIAATGVWWWTAGGADKPVTEAEARRFLDRIVSAARAKDFEAVCELNGTVGNCRDQLRKGCDDTPFGPDPIVCTETVPPEPPTVASTRYHQKGPGGTAGRVLVLTGTDGIGRPYKSELMVFRENRTHFKAINAVYWSNSYILEGATSSPSSSPE
jgi:hypothetical protein